MGPSIPLTPASVQATNGGGGSPLRPRTSPPPPPPPSAQEAAAEAQQTNHHQVSTILPAPLYLRTFLKSYHYLLRCSLRARVVDVLIGSNPSFCRCIEAPAAHATDNESRLFPRFCSRCEICRLATPEIANRCAPPSFLIASRAYRQTDQPAKRPTGGGFRESRASSVVERLRQHPLLISNSNARQLELRRLMILRFTGLRRRTVPDGGSHVRRRQPDVARVGAPAAEQPEPDQPKPAHDRRQRPAEERLQGISAQSKQLR